MGLTNKFLGQSKQPVPEVGMAATFLSWSDRAPGTVIWVSTNQKRIKVQADNYENVSTEKEKEQMVQRWEYSRDPDGTIREYSLRKDGSWTEKGSKESRVLLGVREKYWDPSF